MVEYGEKNGLFSMNNSVLTDLQKMRILLAESIDSSPLRISAYFKTGVGQYAEHDQFIGIRVPTLRKISKQYIHIGIDDLIVLLKSPYNEERLLSLLILIEKYNQSSIDDQAKLYNFYCHHIAYVNNWNLVDSSAPYICGAYLYLHDRSSLLVLVMSSNMWARRIAIVSTMYFIRKNDFEMTFELSKILLNDSEDLIHKAVGWMLREIGKRDMIQLINFLKQYANQMPTVMYRYATEKISKVKKRSIKKFTRNHLKRKRAK